MNRTEAIKKFLVEHTRVDLSDLYNAHMEVQVNVNRCNGTRIEKVSADGKFKWPTWTNSDQTEEWKNFRIPRNADTDPEYTDRRMTFDLDRYVQSIGMTGWDWFDRKSIYFAFDFDSIVNHKAGLTSTELQEIQEVAMRVPWITVRKSTSGSGFHFYIFLDEPFLTANHIEHAAVARSILSKLTAETGYPFHAKVDVCGGNMWIWHEKMIGTDGLTLVRQGEPFQTSRIPKNWREHLEVVSGKTKKIRPRGANGLAIQDLTAQKTLIGLDDEHLRIIKALEDTDAYWDSDNHLFVAHTFCLKQIHDDLGLRGYFETLATGRDAPHDLNCFCFPLTQGAWYVYRFHPGMQEDKSWQQDSKGWTCTYFNRHPDLATIARAFSAVKTEKGSYMFHETAVAREALQHLGLSLDVPMHDRKTYISETTSGEIKVKIERDTNSDDGHKMREWEPTKDRTWTRLMNPTKKAPKEETIGISYDDCVRHLISFNHEDMGWVIKDNSSAWNSECAVNVKMFFRSKGKKDSDIEVILGAAVCNPWRIVNRPFQPEFPGGRDWNRNAPQLAFKLLGPEAQLQFPTWEKVLNHLGTNLDNAVLADKWCIDNNVTTGAQYLTLWIASIFQAPNQPTPYLFFYGDQGTGKSLFHEMLALLMTRGYVRADEAMQNKGGFNGELNGAVLCVVEETHLGRNRVAYSHLKDWVTSIKLPIHTKGLTPFNVENTTHWCQFSNDQDACPVFTGDKRITFLRVDHLTAQIPKKIMLQRLREEGPAFLTHIVLRTVIPETNDRLNIPPLHTQDKEDVERANESSLEVFIRDNTFFIPGQKIQVGEFFEKFQKWLRAKDPNELIQWGSSAKVTKEMAMAFNKIFQKRFTRGRDGTTRQWCYGNMSWEPVEPNGMFVTHGETLVRIDFTE